MRSPLRSYVALAPLALALALVGCAKDAPQPSASSTTTATSATPVGAAGSAAPAAAGDTHGNPPGSTNPGEITVGKPPPDFTAKASNGTDIHLAALKGKPVVVYFYPKDETPGCTTEACSFRDAWNDLSKKGVVLIGVSGDTDESHKAFAEHHKLPFLLVSDPDGKIAALFGVPFHVGFAKRQSFVIGPDGNVKKIYREVDVTKHAAEIAADVGP